MKKRILLTIAYDGTSYFGWQKQKDKSIKTVQREIENALGQLFKCDIECEGSSRTDKGVHALGQRAVIEVDTTIPTSKIPIAAYNFMPDDITIVEAEDVNDDFNVRFDVKNKTYEYKILNDKIRNPLLRNFTEFIKGNLDIISMEEAGSYICGTHDFKSFCATGSSVKSTVRTVYYIKVKRENNIVTILINGNGFLYNMVRIIAGTIVDAGLGKFPPEHVKDILDSLDRTKAGKTLGPHGLTLKKIYY